MGRVFKPTYTRPDGFGGRVKVQVKDWYVEYTDHLGEQQRERVGKDKRAAESALARLQERAARLRLNIPDPTADAEARAKPTGTLADEFLAELSDRGRSAGYRAEAKRILDAVLTACKWHTWADVTEASLIKHLAKKRADTSPSTANGHLRIAKAWANWYSDRIRERNPLKVVKAFNEKVDRKRSRRVLTDAELDRLCAAAEAAPVRHNTEIDGPLRAILYRVAGFTGLRASELASLTPAHFDLDAETPTVTIQAKDAKGRREDSVPLPDALVTLLRPWLKGKGGRSKLFPGKWAEHRRQVRWIERDAARAGLGEGVHFHGLRRQFVTRLVKGGADVDEVRRLARHKNVQTTLDHYAETGIAALGRTVNRVKPLG